MRHWLWLAAVGCGLPDEDADGWADDLDCAPADAAVHPGAAEVCNAVDDDCDGGVDLGAADATPWYADADGDTHGDPHAATVACEPPTGAVETALDCDDLDGAVHPGAAEGCNGLDDDCDRRVDEDVDGTVTRYLDLDGDGHGDPLAATLACVAPANAVPLSDDCDDTLAAVRPGAVETCDGVDQDCDGAVDDDASDATLWFPDFDLDGFGWTALPTPACAAPAGFIVDGTDCDDFDAANHPGADERCDSVDNDCDTLVDGPDAVDPTTWYRDNDGDGFGSSSTAEDCDAPEGYVALAGDCNDTTASVSPFADEDCGNGVDDDCNGLVDECGGAVGGPTVALIGDVAAASWTGAILDDRLDVVVSAGDLDGDGFDDLAIGAPRADGATTNVGAAYIVYGGPTFSGDTSLATAPRFLSSASDDRLTEDANLQGVGDLDGDGLAELMVGGPNVGSTGFVGLLYGSPARVTGSNTLGDFDASFSGTQIGSSVSGLGDVDGDGLDDASFADRVSGTGVVYLLFGDPVRPSGATPTAGLPKVVGAAGSQFGYAQGAAGADLDGDGLADVAMGAMNSHVAVLYGDAVRPGTVDETTLPTLTVAGSVDLFGTMMRSAGDLDDDGYPDLLVADHNFDSAGGPQSGQVWVVGGAPTRLVGAQDIDAASFATIQGIAYSGQCGWGVSGLGDFSGDGVDDAAVGAPGWSEPYLYGGGVGVYQGPLGGVVYFDDADLLLEGSAGTDGLGMGMGAGDFDGDGLVDLVAPAYGVSGSRGRAYLVLGGTL